mmetsp:Transcript_9658/g.40985  ORF Transcript_9658/g.40985 Transcript_9658/m.40985 type:complete len:208 (-) Transcript_9658:820-1443(-)
MNTFVPSGCFSARMIVVSSPTRSPGTPSPSSSSSLTTYSPLGSCFRLFGVIYATNSRPPMVTSTGLGRHKPATTLPMSPYRSEASSRPSSGRDSSASTLPFSSARAACVSHAACSSSTASASAASGSAASATYRNPSPAAAASAPKVSNAASTETFAAPVLPTQGESLGALGRRTGLVTCCTFRATGVFLKLENMFSMPSTTALMPS